MKRHFFGLYRRVFKPLNLFQGVKKKVRFHKRVLLELHLGDWIPQNIYFLGAYETKEIDFVSTHLKAGGCFVDVGANIGLFTLVASSSVGASGTVISFEPFERNYRQLVNHVSLNGCTNVMTERLALSDEPGSMILYLDESEKDFGMVTGYSRAYSYTEEVQKITLDRYLEEVHPGAGPVTMIKIDVEGGEYPVLLGMANTLRKDRPLLLVEINPEHYHPSPFSLAHIEEYLSPLGYRKYYLDSKGELTASGESADNSNNYIFRKDGDAC